MAVAGFVMAFFGVLDIVAAIVGGIVAGVALGHVASECKQPGPGTHHVNGFTDTCS